MAVKVNQVPRVKRATLVAHSQERILLLVKVKRHGKKSMVAGGGHLTSDEFFRSMKVGVQKKEIDVKEKEKEDRIGCE